MTFARAKTYWPSQRQLRVAKRHSKAYDVGAAALVRWRYDNLPQARTGETFGNIWYDPAAAVWRQFVHAAADTGAGTIVQYTSANWCGPWGSRATVLDKGAEGTWEAADVGICFGWYEAGETRPWRMVYRGKPASGATQIGLATSVDGTTWERKDTAGNALTDPVIPNGGVGAWDAGSITLHGIIKYNGTYYLPYGTVSSALRLLGMATSTDLVTWTKDANNPWFTGVVDYDDAGHTGTPDEEAGYACPDIVRWDNGATPRFVLYSKKQTATNASTEIQCFTAATPDFQKANRTYVGKVVEATDAAITLEGSDVVGVDCPAIITDTIERNVKTSVLTGEWVPMLFSPKGAAWNHCFMLHSRTMHGASTSNITADLPVTGPVHRLTPTGPDANTIALWLPGQTGTLRDLSTTGNLHLTGEHGGITTSGVSFTAANSEFCRWDSGDSTVISKLEAITGDFTLEARVTFDSQWETGSRAIIFYGTTSSVYHFLWRITGASGPAYTMQFYSRSGNASKAVTNIDFGAIVIGTQYRLALCKTGGKLYGFKDGVLLNAGGTAYDWTLDTLTEARLYIGNDVNKAMDWSGYIDEIRISDAARWTSNYTAAQLTHIYKTPGYIYGEATDFVGTGPGCVIAPSTTPTGTTVTKKAREASSASDQSTTDGDFTAITTDAPATRYQQYELVLAATDTTQTPSVQRMYQKQYRNYA